MIPGLNHNVRYRDLVFHVQTEDSGAPRCQLTTHVFHEGSVLAHTRSPYADEIMSLAVDARGPAVKKQMQEQHKGLLKKLVSGALDPVLIKHRIIIDEELGEAEAAKAADSIPAGPIPPGAAGPAPSRPPPRARELTPAHPAVLDATVATPLDEASSIDLEVDVDLASLAAGPIESGASSDLAPPSAVELEAVGLDARPTDPTRDAARDHAVPDDRPALASPLPAPPVRAVAARESEVLLPQGPGTTSLGPTAPTRAAAEPRPSAPAPSTDATAPPPMPRVPATRSAVEPVTAAPPPAARGPLGPARAAPSAPQAAPAATTPAATPPPRAPAPPQTAPRAAAPAARTPASTKDVAAPAAGPAAPGEAPPRKAPVIPAAPRTLHASIAQAAGREPPPPPSGSWNEATPPHMRTSLPGVDETELRERLTPMPLAEVPSTLGAPPASRSPPPASRSPVPTSRSPRPLDEAAALRELLPAPLRDASPAKPGAKPAATTDAASTRPELRPAKITPGADAPRGPSAADPPGVPPADTSGAWLRARPPIQLDPAMPVVSTPSSSSGATLPGAPAVAPEGARATPGAPTASPGAHPPGRKPNVRPQTRPPSSIRAPLVEPSRAVTEEHATHAYGRTIAERPATTREIDASVRRTSAPPPMGIPDARTERILHPRPPPPRPSSLDHEADTHLDLRAIPPEFLASVLADRGTGDLIADLSLANPSWAPGRALTRPPPPPVPDELREAADPTIDEILLGLSPTDDELIGDPRAPGAMSSPLADAAWLEPELGLAATPRPQLPATPPRAPGIAPPSAWATERSTQTTGRTLPPGPPSGRGAAPPAPSESADATLLDLPREELEALRAGVLPPLPPRAEALPRGDTTSRSAPVRGRPVTPPTGPITPAAPPSPASARPAPSTTRPQPAAAGRAMSSPRRGASNAAPPNTTRTGDLPPRHGASAREESSIRRVDDPSLDDIIQGYLDTKKRR